MNKLLSFTFFLLALSCSSSKLYIGQEEGSIYTTQQLRREPMDGKKVTLEARVHKKLNNDFYLLKDTTGLILAKIKPALLGEDTSYNAATLFRLTGETDTESQHFYVEIEDMELIVR